MERWHLTDDRKCNECNNGASNTLPSNLLMVEEVEGILVGDDVANASPASVEKRENRESSNMSPDWLTERSARRARQ